MTRRTTMTLSTLSARSCNGKILLIILGSATDNTKTTPPCLIDLSSRHYRWNGLREGVQDRSPAALPDPAGALNEGRDGRRAHEAADDAGQAVHAEGKRLPRELLLRVHEPCTPHATACLGISCAQAHKRLFLGTHGTCTPHATACLGLACCTPTRLAAAKGAATCAT